jgi:hypothetical protein
MIENSNFNTSELDAIRFTYIMSQRSLLIRGPINRRNDLDICRLKLAPICTRLGAFGARRGLEERSFGKYGTNGGYASCDNCNFRLHNNPIIERDGFIWSGEHLSGYR